MSDDKRVRFTTVLEKYPTYRDDSINWCWKWLAGKRKDDNAEGLWRVHNNLYDLSDFVKTHPGGSDWLSVTKGTDITEAFESYHLSTKPSLVLPKYFVREAKEPRNYKFTFEDDGFYRTLKRRVAEKLETIEKDGKWKSKLCLDIVLVSLFVSSVFAVRVEDNLTKALLILIAAQFASWLNAMSHNFIHQRNNWRMYVSYIVLFGWRDWRVFHAISHHLYPNSFTDLEIIAYEPLLRWIPLQKRTRFSVMISFIVTPFVYLFAFHGAWALRFIGIAMLKERLHWEELLALLLPLAMFLFGNMTLTWDNIISIVIIWNVILLAASFVYNLVGINAGHHLSKQSVHEGDEFKSLDYGIYQVAATIDRTGAKSNLFFTLTFFGDHVLHHLFPSLDHSLLPQIRETVFETCQEFETEIRECTMLEALVGQFKQLGRIEPVKLKFVNNV